MSEAVPGRKFELAKEKSLQVCYEQMSRAVSMVYSKGTGTCYTCVACSSVTNPNQVHMLFFFSPQFATQKIECVISSN